MTTRNHQDTSMHPGPSAVAEGLGEQLSAWFDGELPESEARFLQRRLEHDPELRAMYLRMQAASSCLRNQPWRPMDEGLAGRVHATLADEATPAATRRTHPWRWAAAASVAALAFLLVPRLGSDGTPSGTPVASRVEPGSNPVPSPAVADLVVPRTVLADASAQAAPATVADRAAVLETSPAAAESPMPLSTQSPADFPLAETGNARQWPRSQLVAAGNAPALEAYLVRHNQMMASDGLGGFVPYVDVVAGGAATDDAATTPDAATAGEGRAP
jgi:anti-sigma factor RsiW